MVIDENMRIVLTDEEKESVRSQRAASGVVLTFLRVKGEPFTSVRISESQVCPTQDAEDRPRVCVESSHLSILLTALAAVIGLATWAWRIM